MPAKAASKLVDKAVAYLQGSRRQLGVDERTGGGTDAAYAALSGKPVIESLGLPGFGYHSDKAEYVDIGAIPRRLYMASKLIMDLGAGSNARQETAMLLSADQEAIRDAVRDFAQAELWPHAPRWDREHSFPEGGAPGPGGARRLRHLRARGRRRRRPRLPDARAGAGRNRRRRRRHQHRDQRHQLPGQRHPHALRQRAAEEAVAAAAGAGRRCSAPSA